MIRNLLCVALLFVLPVCDSQADEAIHVVVWDEQQPKQKQAYSNFLGNQIAAYLKTRPGLSVSSVRLDDADQGLPDTLLDQCDVLLWWGHVRHDEISETKARQLVERVKSGQLSLVSLHSAHWSLPFMIAMEERAKHDALQKMPANQRKQAKVIFVGRRQRSAPSRDAPLTPSAKYQRNGPTTLVLMQRPNCCFPAYRPDGAPSTIRTMLPGHPIAKGLPSTFTVQRTEMYDEPFHVPPPDEVVFEETWEQGERFRSGAVWNLGAGKVFYFRPGHEIYGVYLQQEPLTVIENAVRWLASTQEKK